MPKYSPPVRIAKDHYDRVMAKSKRMGISFAAAYKIDMRELQETLATQKRKTKRWVDL